MSFQRRTALIDFARHNGAFVFEDDYDSEFRFTGPPLPCLQGLDSSGRVIYAGTMSKILYPSLRLGYLVVAEQLADSIAKVRAAIDQHSPAIDQAILARFITEGFFSATSNGCEKSMPSDASSSSRNSMNYSVTALFFRFQKPD